MKQTMPGASATGTAGADAAHCADMVRRGDRDRWLTALFAPEGARRDALMALYAWNLELARIPDTVSEPLLGQMRLQWWRETVAAAHAGDPRAQPIARELCRAVQHGALPLSAFQEILDARERDVTAEPPADMAALEAHAASTAGALAALAGRCLVAGPAATGGGDGGEVDAAARAAGTAYGLAGLVRAMPWHAERGRVYLPVAELRAAGVVAENLSHRSNPPGLYAVVELVCARASAQLAASRQALAALPPRLRREALPAVLPAALAAQDLARLRRAQFDPERPRVHAPPPLRQLQLLRAALRGHP